MITIRSYQASDAPHLWEVFFHTVRNINLGDYTSKQVKAWAPDFITPELWKSRTDRIKPFIAEIDGVIAGYADLQPDGMIDHFFCHHLYQGKGVARALMAHIHEQAKQRSISRLYSEVSITARPFYEHSGFRVVNEQTIEIRGQKLNNFVMEKLLSDVSDK
ncbi:GNAT family N-acetyltransferase [Vibrio sp. T187]|uniref:GNAT family N-acetyltransferase n=1 Tax=Vibrio TaxID=662 RepID=UPI0010C952B3|nr:MULTISPECIES: GNAT family N-acetyltransferase [Vibrio]MBW3694575.1 GNAT family N-acetyltransferase [Vibrio sp. T187]